MTPMRSLAAALGLGSLLGMSCYSEPRPPSTYRFACDADGDCNANEICRRGRCEQPCSTIELAVSGFLGTDVPCPVESGFATCINGACANTCALGSDYCPPDYSCLDIGIEGGGGGFVGGSNDPVGVCTLPCDDELCPAGEACDEDGLCKPIDCSTEPCPDGFVCTPLGMCLPSCAGGSACPDGFSCSTVLPGLCEPECFPTCAGDEKCFFGTCATPCTVSEDCPDPEKQACFFGVCGLREDEGTGTGSGSSGEEPSGSTTTGGEASTGGSTGDATGSGTGTGSGSDSGSTGMGASPADAHEERR